MIGIGTSLLFGRRSGKVTIPEPDVYYDLSLSESEEVVEDVVYPYPLMNEDEINGSGDWKSEEGVI